MEPDAKMALERRPREVERRRVRGVGVVMIAGALIVDCRRDGGFLTLWKSSSKERDVRW